MLETSYVHYYSSVRVPGTALALDRENRTLEGEIETTVLHRNRRAAAGVQYYKHFNINNINRRMHPFLTSTPPTCMWYVVATRQ